MVAVCVVIGWICKSYFTFGTIRVTFDNFPLMLVGILLGPVWGAVVGVASDLVSCLMSGYAINPIITLGAASVGLVSGVLSRYIIKGRNFASVLILSLASHAVGSVVIKSIGLWTIYRYPFYAVIGPRIPLYIVIAVVEAYFMYAVLKNKRLNTMFGNGEY
jgi:ECF transporter S component (folate family)